MFCNTCFWLILIIKVRWNHGNIFEHWRHYLEKITPSWKSPDTGSNILLVNLLLNYWCIHQSISLFIHIAISWSWVPNILIDIFSHFSIIQHNYMNISVTFFIFRKLPCKDSMIMIHLDFTGTATLCASPYFFDHLLLSLSWLVAKPLQIIHVLFERGWNNSL